MRQLETIPNDWSKFAAPERERLRELMKNLTAEYEDSEIGTGKMLVEVRALTQPQREFANFLEFLPLTSRTAYRRIKTYEKAEEIWPEEVIDAAIEKRIKIVGWSEQKPMGLYEDLPAPPKPLTPQKIEQFLDSADLFVRRANRQKINEVDPYAGLKQCFRLVERVTQSLSDKERTKFLEDLVGLQMTLLGFDKPHKFSPTQVPQNFWTSQLGYVRSSETRARISKAATKRWERVREANNQAKKQSRGKHGNIQT